MSAVLDDAPDPVEQPSKYREFLLSLVGDDDPAAVQAGTPEALQQVLSRAGPALRESPADGEWSVIQVAGHIADAELVAAARYRWILAHDAPDLLGYDQDLWVDRLRHQEDEPEALLALFTALRNANLALWERTPPADRPRYGVHAERGPESYDVLFRMLAGHDRFHLEQAEETLRKVTGAT
jgi:hypothetical protein